MDRRRAARGAPLSGADELENALRLFFHVPSSRSRKRARSEALTEAPEGGEEALKRIKRVLRDAEVEAQSTLVQRVYAVVMARLDARKVAPVVVEKAVRLSEELFRRSAVFRKLVAAQVSQFYARLLTACGEDGSAAVRRARPPSRNPQLAMVLSLIEQWREDFGGRYLPLVAGYDVLVARGYEFPRVREVQVEAQVRAQQTQAHHRRVRDLKAQQRRREMDQFVPEMEALLLEMHQIFEILVPTLDAFQLPETVVSPASGEAGLAAASSSAARRGNTPLPDGNGEELQQQASLDSVTTASSVETGVGSDGEEEDDDVEWESVGPDGESGGIQHEDPSLGEDEDEQLGLEGIPHEGMDMNQIVQAYGLGSSSYQLTIEIPTSVCERSAENEVLFRSLADGILRLRKRFLPLVRDWLEYAASPGSAHLPASSERGLGEQRELQDLYARLQDVELKWEDLVRESERKRFARLTPAVVTVPTDAYEPELPEDPRKRRVVPRVGRGAASAPAAAANGSGAPR